MWLLSMFVIGLNWFSKIGLARQGIYLGLPGIEFCNLNNLLRNASAQLNLACIKLSKAFY